VRILVLTNLYPPVVRGGYEVECRGVVEHLRRDHDVVVLASRHGREQCPAGDPVRRELPWVRPNVLRDSLLAGPDSLRAARIVRRVLDEVRPELIYVWNGAGMPNAAIAVLQDSGVPVAFRVCEHWFGRLYADDVFTRHLTPGETGLRGLWARGMRAFNRLPGLRVDPGRPRPAAVSWNSEHLREAAGMPRAVRAVHEDVTLPAVPGTEPLDGLARAPATPSRILFAGRLEAFKGPQVAIRALAVLRERHGLEAELVLAGEGEPGRAEELAALARELGVGDHVRLPGRLAGEAFRAEVAAASAWVVPSVWDEPAGLVCTEAALARVPVVLSQAGGLPEMLRPDEHALAFARDDHEGCAASLAAILRGGEEVDARVERAYARGHELSFGPYVTAMDAFLADAVRLLRA
jgi:glycosyltransferase involved in cell wall biosynthesis